jgi:hypothetical protein
VPKPASITNHQGISLLGFPQNNQKWPLALLLHQYRQHSLLPAVPVGWLYPKSEGKEEERLGVIVDSFREIQNTNRRSTEWGSSLTQCCHALCPQMGVSIIIYSFILNTTTASAPF